VRANSFGNEQFHSTTEIRSGKRKYFLDFSDLDDDKHWNLVMSIYVICIFRHFEKRIFLLMIIKIIKINNYILISSIGRL